MENTVIQRVKEIVKAKSKSVNAFAKAIGMEQATVHRYMAGERKMTFGFILAIMKTYPDISAEWLLRGEGEIYKNADHAPLQIQDIQNLKDENQSLKDEILQLQRELIDTMRKLNDNQQGKKRT